MKKDIAGFAAALGKITIKLGESFDGRFFAASDSVVLFHFEAPTLQSARKKAEIALRGYGKLRFGLDDNIETTINVAVLSATISHVALPKHALGDIGELQLAA